MKMRREGTGTPHPQSLAATNGSAADLYSNLNEMLDWFELLRRADFDEPPDPMPEWWDHFDQVAEWKRECGLGGCPVNRETRVEFASFKARSAIGRLLMDIHRISRWERLTSAIPVSDAHKHVFEGGREALRNLLGMLDQRKPGQLYSVGVVPDERHLDLPLPKTWPGLKSLREEEKAATRQARISVAKLINERRPRETIKTAGAQIREALVREREARRKRHVIAQRCADALGFVTPQELHAEIAKRSEWKEFIRRWKLRVADVQKLIDHLGDASTVQLQPPDEWIRSDEAAKRTDMSPDAFRSRANRKGWPTKRSGRMRCYRLSDLQAAYPNKNFRPVGSRN